MPASSLPFNSNLPQVWIKVFENLFQGNVNWATIIISILACTFLIIIRNVNAALTKLKYYKKFPVPIPSQLLLVSWDRALGVGVGGRVGVHARAFVFCAMHGSQQ